LFPKSFGDVRGGVFNLFRGIALHCCGHLSGTTFHERHFGPAMFPLYITGKLEPLELLRRRRALCVDLLFRNPSHFDVFTFRVWECPLHFATTRVSCQLPLGGRCWGCAPPPIGVERSAQNLKACESYTSGGEAKKARLAIEDADIETKQTVAGLNDAHVDLLSLVGYSVKCKYNVYSPSEFIKEFGTEFKNISSGRLRLTLTEIKNECHEMEEVILLRKPGRVLTVESTTGLQFKEAVMQMLIRKGQAAETFDWARKNHRKTLTKFHSKFTRIPFATQAADAAKKYIAELKRKEGKEADKDGEASSDDESESSGVGLAMPDSKPAPKAKAKAAGGKRKAESAPAGTKPPKAKAGPIAPPSSLSKAGISTSVPGSASSSKGMNPEDKMSEHGGAPSLASVLVAGKAAKGYFQFDEILAGTKNKNILTGARRHLGTLNGNTRAYNAMERELACAEHCFALAPDRLNTLTVLQMQKAITQARTLCGVIMPFHIMLALCSAFSNDLLKKSLYSEFACSLRPWALPGEKKFNEVSPHFSALIAAQCDKDSEDLAVKALHEALAVFFVFRPCLTVLHIWFESVPAMQCAGRHRAHANRRQ
jgi:hypothetical protein